jgi:hypothetical protein
VISIGGYFGLGDRLAPLGDNFSRSGLYLQSGRGCLSYLIERFAPRKAYLPYYSCDSMFAPFLKAGVQIEFYPISQQLCPTTSPQILEGEVVVYINYFGVLNKRMSELDRSQPPGSWFDNTHAFYYEPLALRCWHFNSARKFLGVPDGAILSGPSGRHFERDELPRNTNVWTTHLILRYLGLVDEGFSVFREYESTFDVKAKQVSEIGQKILTRTDHRFIKERRFENFKTLNQELGSMNLLDSEILQIEVGSAPFCYPFLPREPIPHETLWKLGIFAPKLWPECLDRCGEGFEWEKRLSRELLPLPIDQRYGKSEMEMIVNIILQHGKRA